MNIEEVSWVIISLPNNFKKIDTFIYFLLFNNKYINHQINKINSLLLLLFHFNDYYKTRNKNNLNQIFKYIQIFHLKKKLFSEQNI